MLVGLVITVMAFRWVGLKSLTFDDGASFPGSTALLVVNDSSMSMVVGTKSGEIRNVTLDPIEQSLTDARRLPATSSLPIYGLAMDITSSTMFSGGADRYVSVWNWRDNRWTRTDRLGPHTGWVKDVVFQHQTRRLYSIGCNCIEAWKESPEGNWTHWKRALIENSPEKGCTLSSDLLCLCAMEGTWLCSGGVDGRIHIWDSINMKSPSFSVGAHRGRVNCFVYDEVRRILVSGSHDGRIKFWRFDNKTLHFVAEVLVGQGSRVTAMALMGDDNASKTAVVYGTQRGELGLVHADDQTAWSIGDRIELTDEPVINALSVFRRKRGNGFRTIAVAHSKGLTKLEFDL